MSLNLCLVPVWHCTVTTPLSYDRMGYVAYANYIFQIVGGFSDMHSLDNLGNFKGVFELVHLNPLICMFLLGFLGQMSRKLFSKITLAATEKE